MSYASPKDSKRKVRLARIKFAAGLTCAIGLFAPVAGTVGVMIRSFNLIAAGKEPLHEELARSVELTLTISVFLLPFVWLSGIAWVVCWLKLHEIKLRESYDIGRSKV